MLAITILIAVQALGNLLVVAILIAPGAAALRVCGRLEPALVLAGAFAVAAGVAGIYVSYWADLAAGASIALAAVAIFALAQLAAGFRARRQLLLTFRRWSRA